MEPYLSLLDVGYLVNTSCPPLLQPTRDVDLILSLDYNLHGAFQVGRGLGGTSYRTRRLGQEWEVVGQLQVGLSWPLARSALEFSIWPSFP